jgi:hypothetical protein
MKKLRFAVLCMLPLGALAQQAPERGRDSARKDFTAIEQYLCIADTLQAGKEPGSVEWQALFSTFVHQALIQADAMDTVKFKKDMRRVYLPGREDTARHDADQEEHLKYRKQEALVKAAIRDMKAQNVSEQIKKILFPFLPQRLRKDSLLPRQIYLFNSGDATAASGYVINDMLLTAKINQVEPGLISAHEGFHAMITEASEHRLNPAADQQSNNFGVFRFLMSVSQEGIADLIDKPLLMTPGSPVFEEWKELSRNENKVAVRSIHRLDSVFSKAYRRGRAAVGFETLMFRGYSRNGGHIPGRYMANIIRRAGLLKQAIEQADDPVYFFETYQRAARAQQPRFSKAALLYLKKIREAYLLPVPR